MSNESYNDTFAKGSKEGADGASQTFHDTGAAARTTAKDLGVLASAVQSDAKDGFRQLTNIAEEESSKVVKYVRASIQERPNLTVGVVAGLGVLIGLVLSGRR